MLFSFRPMLVITLLAGLVPLAVIAAPLSQVEGDIVRRNNEPKEGDKFHFNGQDHTLGHHLGKGSTASAHTIAGDHHEEHKHIIAKVFHTDKPKDRESEIENLKKVNEYHGEAKTEHGHPIILASKKEGVHITKTNAWNNAKTKDEKGKLLKHAQTLVADRNTHHANKHGLIHTDNNDGNVLFQENEHGHLTKANFIDWGLAKPAEKDEDGKLKKTTLDAITGRARRFNP